jgi:hypothetical protein
VPTDLEAEVKILSQAELETLGLAGLTALEIFVRNEQAKHEAELERLNSFMENIEREKARA